ncbi:MAG: hypothetical protein EA412_02575 [Chitinophagaceae bacterium]|nr:MAG: hypothetical protein EA412_02575 [Chitinophagaceae bacterium]
MKLFFKILTLFLLTISFLSFQTVLSQNIYQMNNAQVDDCYGFFTDSQAGDDPNCPECYDHNENYTFTICVPDGDTIVMDFINFQTEAVFDTIRFFDGPDTNSVQIGPTHSGTTLPGQIIALSGCLTIHFGSDASVAADGWFAEWYTILAPPDTPAIDIPAVFDCETEILILQLDVPVLCDSVLPQWINVNGPSNSGVVSANAINCTDGLTTEIQISLQPSLDLNGSYTIDLTTFYLDVCDSLHILSSDAEFDVINCPLEVEVFTDLETICEGECIEVWAEVFGGIPASYVYDWNISVPAGNGVYTYCPTESEWITLTVSDTGGSAPGSDSVWITVISNPVTQDDTGFCQSEAAVTLSASPAGGVWFGPGITDSIGIFDPNTAGGGIHSIIYELNNCRDTLIIDILGIEAGPPQAACPGTDSFQLSGALPAAGTWTGPNVTPDGIFDPSTSGSFDVFFNYDTCTAVKTVSVENLSVQPSDTICVSDSTYILTATPFGGIWSGTGIINPLFGVIDLQALSSGAYEYIYSANGCADTLSLNLQFTDAGSNFTVCPHQGNFFMPAANPPGGTWSGNGIVDNNTGEFNPFYNNGNNFNSNVIYTVDGCSDTVLVRGRNTGVGIDSLFFCLSDSIMPLNAANTQRVPGGGSWSGNGVQFGPPRFNPALAGPGIHTIYYTANSCVDSFTAIVYPQADFQFPTAFCSNINSVDLNNYAPSGSWYGPGVFPPGSDSFSPQNAGAGVHTLYFVSETGNCPDSTQITVVSPQTPDILLDNSYCFIDSEIAIFSNNNFVNSTGNGVLNNNFNPATAGPGTHTISWDYDDGTCQLNNQFNVTVLEPLSLEFFPADTSICFGDDVMVSVEISGGTGNYQQFWNNSSQQDTAYLFNELYSDYVSIMVADGCSEAINDSIFIEVYDEINLDFTTNDPLCYGKTGFAEVSASPASSYTYEWQTNPPVNQNRLEERVRNTYEVIVIDNVTNCQVNGSVYLPGYELVTARFMPNPSNDCVNLSNPSIEFIDISQGAVEGLWQWGDGRSKPYDPGDFHIHNYRDTGTYTVQLTVYNEGGCSDSYSLDVCVRATDVMFIPNAFSPAGMNNEWKVTAFGVNQFNLKIFNRWGEIIFESSDIKRGWDGTHDGYAVPMGGYPYLIEFLNPVSGSIEKRKGMIVLYR